MKKIKNKKGILMPVIAFALAMTLLGCGSLKEKEQTDYEASEEQLSDNVILTETGEVIEKEENVEQEESIDPTPSVESSDEELDFSEDYTPITPTVELELPEHEQVITEVDMAEPTDNELQLVFLGDSIFDNNRDGTGVPYLTAQKCGAGVYNLAIGGTCASIEWGESQETGKWTSSSLCGVVRAMKKEIPTDVFAGTRTRDILDNPENDFSKTDYFIVEYGLNDYFRATPLDIEGTRYDLRCYTGALRYAVTTLREIAPDATIILCSPTYAQFYNKDGYMVGEGNMTNTGYGTLFDYKGICDYVAHEQQTLFFNAYQDLGIDGYTAEEYLEDGVHLTEAGRELYADALSKMILKYEETKNN